MTSSLHEKLTGRQRPYNLHSAPGDTTHGEKALKLSRRMRQNPFPWQSWVVEECLKTKPDGSWTYDDIVLIVPRQNGKSWVLSLIIVYYVFVLRRNVVFTAQRWPTAEDIYKRTWSMVESIPSLSSKVARKTCSQGKGTIELRKLKGEDEGPHVIMTTRSADMGRGWTRKDLVIYDEAYNLTESETSALAYTQLASDAPQTIYTSSAANADIHFYSEVLTGQRERGIEGKDDELFFAEWMAPDDMPRDEEETWKFANPSYGVIQTAAKIKKIMRGMNTEAGRRSFDVEALGRGIWPSIHEEVHEPIIPFELWNGLFTASPKVIGDCAVGVDITPDGERVGVVSAQRTATGVHLSVADLTDYDRDFVADVTYKAVVGNDAVAVVGDPAGPASILLGDLGRRGIDVQEMGARRVVAACELFLKLVEEKKITHDGSPRWIEALEAAEFRSIRGELGRALTRKMGDIQVLVAATFAVWALNEFEIPAEVPDSVSKTKRFVGNAKPVLAGGSAGVSRKSF